MEEEVFPFPAQGKDLLVREERQKLIEVACDVLRAETLDAGDRLVDELGFEDALDGFDFGEFRHT